MTWSKERRERVRILIDGACLVINHEDPDDEQPYIRSVAVDLPSALDRIEELEDALLEIVSAYADEVSTLSEADAKRRIKAIRAAEPLVVLP